MFLLGLGDRGPMGQMFEHFLRSWKVRKSSHGTSESAHAGVKPCLPSEEAKVCFLARMGLSKFLFIPVHLLGLPVYLKL